MKAKRVILPGLLIAFSILFLIISGSPCSNGLPIKQHSQTSPKEALQKGEKKMIRNLPRSPLSLPLEDVIARRRSIRNFDSRPVEDEQLGAILWAAQGSTDPDRGLRSVPSAGATFPLNTYVLSEDGVFLYHPRDHGLETVSSEDRRGALAQACLGQKFIARAPVVLLFSGVPARITGRYGGRSVKYMDIEAGHAAQNALLAATALGLGGTPVGAFDEKSILKALSLGGDEIPLYVLPIGNP